MCVHVCGVCVCVFVWGVCVHVCGVCVCVCVCVFECGVCVFMCGVDGWVGVNTLHSSTYM